MSKMNQFLLRTLSATALFFASLGLAHCEESAWLTDFEAAKAKAKAEKKLLLVDFTGSDWCGWCIKLHNEVFDKDVFKEAAPKSFVMVVLDYPRSKKLPDELKAQNDKLAKKYDIHGYPTILLLDPEGEVIAHTGYQAGGPEKYVASLTKLVNLHDSVIKMQGELASAKGLDRAKLLDQLVDATTELDSESGKIDTWSKEIVELDSENKAGLKGKYEIRQMLAEINKLIKTREFDGAGKVVEEVLGRSDLSGNQKQEALFAQGYLLQIKKEIRPAIASLKKALEAAPDGPKADQLANFIPYLEGMIKNEEAAVKAKAELETAKGPERLKLLDQAVQAYNKVGNHIDGKDESATVAEWENEIAQLDADNKAGLKSKYQYNKFALEAQKALMARKLDDALAAIEKALAVPGISQEQIDRATILKCACLLSKKDYQAAIDFAKNAQEKAVGSTATLLKRYIDMAEKSLAKAKGDAADKPASPN